MDADLSPGDVIAADLDGTIVLDDGVTTWNPARAREFLGIVKTWGPYVATVEGIHDGDTIEVGLVLAKTGKQKADVDLGFNVHRGPLGTTMVRQSVRLFGCNAPELKTPEGQASVAFLRTLLAVGDRVKLVSYGWDKYGGRIDGLVTLPDGRDLVSAMIAAGQAVPWGGSGPKPV